MPVRFRSVAELPRLSGWPSEIVDDDRITYFTLTGANRDWLARTCVWVRRFNSAQLPSLGWIRDDLSGCPPVAVSRLGGLLGLDADEMPRLLAAYGGWEGRTPRDGRAQVLHPAVHDQPSKSAGSGSLPISCSNAASTRNDVREWTATWNQEIEHHVPVEHNEWRLAALRQARRVSEIPWANGYAQSAVEEAIAGERSS